MKCVICNRALDCMNNLSRKTKNILGKMAEFVVYHFSNKNKYNVSMSPEADQQVAFLVQQMQAQSGPEPVACMACQHSICTSEYSIECDQCHEITDRCVWSLQAANIDMMASTYQCPACKCICYQEHDLVSYVFMSTMCPYCSVLMELQEG